MKKQKAFIRYDEEGDYLEINLKKCKETYFNEVKKDYVEIIEKKTNKLVGYAVFNLTKRKEKFVNVELPIPEGILV